MSITSLLIQEIQDQLRECSHNNKHIDGLLRGNGMIYSDMKHSTFQVYQDEEHPILNEIENNWISVEYSSSRDKDIYHFKFRKLLLLFIRLLDGLKFDELSSEFSNIYDHMLSSERLPLNRYPLNSHLFLFLDGFVMEGKTSSMKYLQETKKYYSIVNQDPTDIVITIDESSSFRQVFDYDGELKMGLEIPSFATILSLVNQISGIFKTYKYLARVSRTREYETNKS